MTNACPKCSAAITGSRHSTDDAPSIFTFACGTVLFATGDMVRGAACLEKQLAKLQAERAGLVLSLEGIAFGRGAYGQSLKRIEMMGVARDLLDVLQRGTIPQEVRDDAS